MELALYAPGLGYYSGGAAKLGKDGDFTTAPELSGPVRAVAGACCSRYYDQSAPHILEFGAGTGKLARDILTEAAHRRHPVESCSIVELSGELRARQQAAAARFSASARGSMPCRNRSTARSSAMRCWMPMPVDVVTLTERGWQSLHHRMSFARLC